MDELLGLRPAPVAGAAAEEDAYQTRMLALAEESLRQAELKEAEAVQGPLVEDSRRGSRHARSESMGAVEFALDVASHPDSPPRSPRLSDAEEMMSQLVLSPPALIYHTWSTPGKLGLRLEPLPTGPGAILMRIEEHVPGLHYGCTVWSVNGETVARRDFGEIIEAVQRAERPLTIGFAPAPPEPMPEQVLDGCDWLGPAGAPRVGSSQCTEDSAHSGPCWFPLNGSRFDVRQPNYAVARGKAPSEASLYDCIGFDLYRARKPQLNLAAKLKLPNIDRGNPLSYVPTVLVLNVMFPLTPPSMFSDKSDTGPMVLAVLTFVMRETTAVALANLAEAAPGVRLLEAYFRRAPQGGDRFKLMGKVRNWSEAGLPEMLSGYNGKPVLVTRSGTWFRGRMPGGLLYGELDVNLGCWCYVARKGLHASWDHLGRAVFDFGTVIESREDNTSPENVLGACSFRGVELGSKNIPKWVDGEAVEVLDLETWKCAK